jgi:hypothetical protein
MPRVLAVSALLLIPCFWQSRIQAGDLSSHLYNAWLAALIKQEGIAGLTVAWQWHNVLFDHLLSIAVALSGYGAAQRISVSLAVLVFFWGAARFIRVAAGECGWPVKVVLGMLSYGYVFHMGFFNYQLSLGIGLWAFSFAWERTRRGTVIALALLPLAAFAHLLPVACLLGLWGFTVAERATPEWVKPVLPLGAITLIAAVRQIFELSFSIRYSGLFPPVLMGADQTIVNGGDYAVVAVCLALVWLLWAVLSFLRPPGGGAPVFRLWSLLGLAAAAALLLPDRIDFPYWRHGLDYVTGRLSLLTGVCACAALALARPAAPVRAMLVLIAVGFAGLIYRDSARLNRLEDQVEQAVRGVPDRGRVVARLNPVVERKEAHVHLIDRACTGRCYSYANYEPSTWAFRVRARGDNEAVLANFNDVSRIEHSLGYAVQPRDLPLWLVHQAGGSGKVSLLELRAGETVEEAARRAGSR